MKLGLPPSQRASLGEHLDYAARVYEVFADELSRLETPGFALQARWTFRYADEEICCFGLDVFLCLSCTRVHRMIGLNYAVDGADFPEDHPLARLVERELRLRGWLAPEATA